MAEIILRLRNLPRGQGSRSGFYVTFDNTAFPPSGEPSGEHSYQCTGQPKEDNSQTELVHAHSAG